MDASDDGDEAVVCAGIDIGIVMPGWHWVAGFAGMRAQCGALCGTNCGTAAIASGPTTGVTITNRRSLAIERCIVLVKPSVRRLQLYKGYYKAMPRLSTLDGYP